MNRVLIIAFVIGFINLSFGQISIFTPDIFFTPSLIKLDSSELFTQKIDSILDLPNDAINTLDSTSLFKVIYISQCSFDGFFVESDYLDQQLRICTSNIYELDTVINLVFLGTPTIINTETSVLKNANRSIVCFLYQNKETSDEIYPFSAQYYHVFSFESGQYLIIHTRIFGPDIRDSMPPGVDTTIIMERL